MPLRCLFRIDKESFRKLDNRLAELGGYEYDARGEELIIKTLFNFHRVIFEWQDPLTR